MKLARAAWCAALLAGAIPALAGAQGFQLNEIGTCAVGRGGAVTGAPCNDASMIYWNPAATVELSGWSMYFGDAVIAPRGSYTSDTTGLTTFGNVPPAFPLHIFANYTNREHKWAAGIGVYVPYGLSNQWPNGFQGNFAGQYAAIQTIYMQPNFAYAVTKDWSIGVGAVYGYSKVTLREALDLSSQYAAPGITFGMLGIPKYTQFANANITGSGTTWGWTAAVHGKVGSDWQVGLRYLSQMDFKYTGGKATFQQVQTGLALAAGNPLGAPAGTPIDALLTPEFITPGGALVSQGANAAINHPAQGQIGLAYTGFTNWLVEADYIMVWWDVFKSIPLNFEGPASANSTNLLEDYNNSWAVRLGAEHAFASGVKGRLGFSYVSTPVPDFSVAPTLPDQNRYNGMLGAGIPLGATWSLDAAYELVYTSGRRGRVDNRTSESQTAADLNSGTYQLWANILSVSFKATW